MATKVESNLTVPITVRNGDTMKVTHAITTGLKGDVIEIDMDKQKPKQTVEQIVRRAASDIDKLVAGLAKVKYNAIMVRRIVRVAVQQAIAADGTGYIKGAYFRNAPGRDEETHVRCPWCGESVPVDEPLHDCQQGE